MFLPWISVFTSERKWSEFCMYMGPAWPWNCRCSIETIQVMNFWFSCNFHLLFFLCHCILKMLLSTAHHCCLTIDAIPITSIIRITIPTFSFNFIAVAISILLGCLWNSIPPKLGLPMSYRTNVILEHQCLPVDFFASSATSLHPSLLGILTLIPILSWTDTRLWSSSLIDVDWL